MSRHSATDAVVPFVVGKSIPQVGQWWSDEWRFVLSLYTVVSRKLSLMPLPWMTKQRWTLTLYSCVYTSDEKFQFQPGLGGRHNIVKVNPGHCRLVWYVTFRFNFLGCPSSLSSYMVWIKNVYDMLQIAIRTKLWICKTYMLRIPFFLWLMLVKWFSLARLLMLARLLTLVMLGVRLKA
jgi:hypothetical protein